MGVKPDIPWFDRTQDHSFVPTKRRLAVARSGGPGRPSGRRASASPWTAASPAAGFRALGKCKFVPVLLAIALTAPRPFAEAAPPSNALTQVSGTPHASVAGWVAEAAQRFALPAAWIDRVMRIESDGDPHAISSRGAVGLMQIMPSTYARLRLTYGLGADPFDARDNILAGAAYLREMFDRYGSPGFLAAYNAGPGRYDAHLTAGRALPRETLDYLSKLGSVADVARPQARAILRDTADWRRSALFVGTPGTTRPAIASPTDFPRPGGLFVDPSPQAPSP